MQLARVFPVSALLAGIALIPALAQAPPTPVGSTSAVQTATLTFVENASVASVNVLTQGAPNANFQYVSGGTCTVGTAYHSGQTCTVKYTFSPTYPGLRYGAVSLYNAATPASAIATTYLQATGDGPQVAFAPGTVSAFATTMNNGADPGGVAIDGAGNIFLCSANRSFWEIPAASGYTTVNPLTDNLGHNFWGLTMDGAGNLYFYDEEVQGIRELTAASGYTRFDTLVTGYSSQNYIGGLAADGQGDLFFTDPANGAVKEALAADRYATVLTLATGFNNNLKSIAVDGNQNVFVAETINNARVKEIVAAGGYTTVVPLGPYLFYPNDIAVDGTGNVYVLPLDFKLREIVATGGYTSALILESGVQSGFFALDNAGSIFLIRNAVSFLRKLDVAAPASHTFATTDAGSTSSDSPLTVTAINNGNQTMHFSNVSYPADFSERAGVATDCTSSTDLSADSFCTLTFRFFPQRSSATGLSTLLNEEISLTDDTLGVSGTEQSFAVSGTETFKPPALTSPTPGSPFGSSSATFIWKPGSAKFFKFRLGNTSGSNNIYGIGQTEKTSVTVSKLPSETVYARLDYLLGNTWRSIAYQYPPAAGTPQLTSPAPGSTLSGSSVTFAWNPGSATTFQFRLGTTAGSNNIYGSGQTSKTSVTVSGLPTNGETVHARLYFMVNGAWQYNDYTYTAQ